MSERWKTQEGGDTLSVDDQDNYTPTSGTYRKRGKKGSRSPKNTVNKLSLSSVSYQQKDWTPPTIVGQLQLDNQQTNSRADSCGPSNGSIVQQNPIHNHYHSIVSLTTNQNQNLRQQNKYLLNKIKQMRQREDKVQTIYEKAKNYKRMYMQSLEQIQMLREECQVYKQQADEMKMIVLGDFHRIGAQLEGNQEDIEEEENEKKQETIQKQCTDGLEEYC